MNVPFPNIPEKDHRNTTPGNDNKMSHNYDSGTGLFAKVASREKQEIILPAIRGQLDKIVSNSGLLREQHRVLDFGCGPFILSIPLLRSSFPVDGYDTSEEMVKTACQILDSSKKSLNGGAEIANQTILTSELSDLKGRQYDVVMMNFVHQVASDKKSLKKLFRDASSYLKDGGYLIITGAHPDWLHKPHTCCEYDVSDPRTLNDGDLYTGRIVDSSGMVTYDLHGDHFWKKDTLITTAQSVGLSTGDVTDIDDKETFGREANDPAYFLMSFRKNTSLSIT